MKLIVNHNEQLYAYKNIAVQLGLSMKKENESVLNPTEFINMHNTFSNEHPDKKEPVDIVFVDEAHLLLSGNNQAFAQKKGYVFFHIDEIMKHVLCML